MVDRPLDLLLVSPDSSAAAYQALAKDYSAIEPPTWALLLAQSCRAAGFGVAILDCGAERLTIEQAVKRIADAKARLTCFVVYGQNPNSGTTSMIGASALCNALKQARPEILTAIVGSHASALPEEVLQNEQFDIVLLNEGVHGLHNLLSARYIQSELRNLPGIGFQEAGAFRINAAQPPVTDLDTFLPGYAWDLLPYDKKPLDLYRAHFWHADYNHSLRTPFAALYTSLGCKFKCDFCMINILNRTNNAPGISAADSPVMRFWSPEFILKEFEKLAALGVTTIRISDEMFLLNPRYYEPLLRGLIERDLGLRMWVYSRVDTARPAAMELLRAAGVRWVALGIESGNQTVRREASKGSFEDVNIRKVVSEFQQADINVLGNYIFGLPDDTLQTMGETLDLALELNTESANFYPCQALPGSPLYWQAKANGWKLPDSYAGYAFLSYESQPLPTRHCSAAAVLIFRDTAWRRYFTNPAYLSLVERKFGLEQRWNVEKLTAIHLRRKLLELETVRAA